MKFPFLLTLILLSAVPGLRAAANKGQRNVDAPPPDVSGFHGREILDVVYGEALNRRGEREALKLDVYRPNETTATHPLPLYVWIHGGAYSVGDKKGSRAICQAMAAKGFVVATLNYRMGWQEHADKTANDPAEMSKAAYRAIQDSNTALGFLVAHAKDYTFDPQWIFVAGASAGASITLNMAYATDALAEQNQPGVTKLLGPLFKHPNEEPNPYKIKAIIPMWGALVTLDPINQKTAIPSLYFHGMKDGTVPYDVGHTFSLETYPKIYGSLPMYRRTQELGVSSQLYLDPTGPHGVFLAQFRVDKVADFLASVMKGEKRSGLYVGNGTTFREVAKGANP